MAWQRCKICSTPGAREFVDSALDEGTELRIISAKLALQNIFIDKSSIHRHSKRCYNVRERALRRKEEFDRTKADARLRVLWPGDSPAIGGPHDVLVFVQFEELVQRNPKTSDSLAPENPAGEENVPEKKLSFFDKLGKLFHHRTETPSAPKPLAVESDPPPAAAPCQHKTGWQEIPGGAKKCVDCGAQTAVFTPTGAMSRKDFFSRTRRFG